MADKYTNEGLIAWSEYVLNGLKVEIEKIDHIVDYSYLRDKILIPSLSDALSNKYITDVEHSILKLTVSKKTQEIQASDIKEL